MIDGRLVDQPAPSGFHQDAIGLLYLKLQPWAMARKAGLVRLAPVDAYLSEHDVLQPDLLFVARSRLAIVRDDGVFGPPDLVVEVRSPSTARRDPVVKRTIYGRSGVKEHWLLDLSARRVETHRFAAGAAKAGPVRGEGEVLASPVLPGLEIPVSGLFLNPAD